MQQHGSKYCARRLPPPWGTKSQNLTFSEHGLASYQIKGNHKCSNMVANIIPADPPYPPPPTLGWVQKVKIQLFQNIVKLHKGNGA